MMKPTVFVLLCMIKSAVDLVICVTMHDKTHTEMTAGLKTKRGSRFAKEKNLNLNKLMSRYQADRLKRYADLGIEMQRRWEWKRWK